MPITRRALGLLLATCFLPLGPAQGAQGEGEGDPPPPPTYVLLLVADDLAV